MSELSPQEQFKRWYKQAAKDSKWADFQRGYFYPSECSRCPRAVFYSRTGTPGASPKLSSFFLTRAGDLYHKQVQADLVACFGDDFVGAEQRVVGHRRIRVGEDEVQVEWAGRLDGYLRKDRTLVEIKSMDKDAYQDFVRHGVAGRSYFEGYLKQCNLYVEAVDETLQEQLERIWIIPCNRSTGQVSPEGHMYSVKKELLDSVWETWTEVEACLMRQDLPARAYVREAHECRAFCAFKKLCWGDDDPQGEEE